jgi:hypothetical protein
MRQHVKLFEEFQQELKIEKRKKGKPKTGEIENFESPEYVVQPAPGDKGFAMFKNAFSKMKKRYETGFFSTTVNNMP